MGFCLIRFVLWLRNLVWLLLVLYHHVNFILYVINIKINDNNINI